MRRISVILSLLLLTIALASLSLAADPEQGKALVEKQCLECHKSEVYGRKVKSMEDLQKKVERCATGTEAGWSAAQKADVIAYLNQEFYKFK